MIPISVVKLDEAAEELAVEVIRSGRLAQGPMVARLEQEFAALVGAEHAVAVNNGTTALVAALEVCDLRPGDEVVTSPFTFVATLNAILEAGATARFADIRDDDFCLDPEALAAAVGPRTRVVLPVHLYGQPADMAAIVPVVQRHGLGLVEDTAQSLGATVDGRGAGSFGLGTFSLYATKNLTTGEGGMITTNDATLADRLRVLRNQGMRQRYQYEVAGHNYRLTDLQAALGIPQLAGYGANVKRRKDNAAQLSAGLADLPGLRLPTERPGRSHVWHQYTVLVTADAAVSRDELVAKLTEQGVGCGVYYPRTVYDYDCYREHPRVVADPAPVAERVARQCLSLPVHHHLTDDEVQRVVEAVRTAVGG
ncbi:MULTISPECIES: DegT/DnrJ/EryC1/StrS family aminotransferase [Micromonospora]|uniref:dTDP-4-amino-4,6-dideoxygalactose transaminase n=1 Tax=Micromonospora yangpuensis TaxID=683228 RepID=A0A1C6UGK0_9ACTN|nr:DegT/DnrJ/EryC1/StrS family aminotransferase [Micromonospora yangpuensis]GGM04994.1 aminotransferase [Micromonospora yangpuensis]SCL53078.1 dTDP-4-amino-4,6-dideoxygalactose transaminase [Micromonospora yangpuensis]